MYENKSENIIQLFPLSIYKAKIGLTENERKILIEEVQNQKLKSKNPSYKIKTGTWTGDTQGFEFLYLNKKFEKLFNLISLNIKKYTECLGVNNDKIDFYYQRAWATIAKGNENISPHQHKQSHISFAYYLKKNTNDGSLNFHNEALHNEIAPGLFYSSSEKSPSKNFFKANFFNAKIVNIHPKVDEIYIFPSKSIHSTSPNKTNEERISVSADISIITKESENIENLITPIDKWMKF